MQIIMAADAPKWALLLNNEVSAVITAMRQNAKWAVVPGKYNEDDQMESEPHFDEFRSLRRKIYEWKDWSSVHPLQYLEPFLKLVRESDVSGPITGGRWVPRRQCRMRAICRANSATCSCCRMMQAAQREPVHTRFLAGLVRKALLS